MTRRGEVRRRYRPKDDDERREVIEALETSGLGVRGFSRETGVPESTLVAWRRRLREKEGAVDGKRSGFVELRVQGGLEEKGDLVADVILGGGPVTVRVARGFDEGELSRLLDLVRRRC